MTMNPQNPPSSSETEYMGPERRKSNSALSTALTSIIDLQQEVEGLARAVNNTVEKQKKSQVKIWFLLFSVIAILLFLGVGTITMRNAEDAANSAERVIKTLDDCLLPGGECYTRSVAAGRQGSVRQMKFNACILLELPEERTENKANKCAKVAFPELPNLDLFDE